jgi:hypothetical protein
MRNESSDISKLELTLFAGGVDVRCRAREEP